MDRAQFLETWRSALEAAKTPLDPEVAEAWLDLLDGEEAEREELEGLIALHARNLGETGRLASVVIRQLLPLVQASDIDLGDTASLLALAADAHVVGAATRLERRQLRGLRERLPVLQLPGGRILACVVGPLDGQLLDVLLGRAFTLAVQTGAAELIIDLSGVEDLDDGLLFETLVGFRTHELAGRILIGVSGLPEPEAWSDRLLHRGVGEDLVRCLESLANLPERGG